MLKLSIAGKSIFIPSHLGLMKVDSSPCEHPALGTFTSMLGLAFLALFVPSFPTHRLSASHQIGIIRSATNGKPDRSMELQLNYDRRCMLDRFLVNGREVIAPDTGVCSAIKVGGQWYTTRSCASPEAKVGPKGVSVSHIRFGGGGVEVEENWTFTANAKMIDWHIDRRYLTGGTIEDTYFPGWDFQENSWDGALLGTGGVAWFKLLSAPVTAYGVHTGDAVFWSKASDDCLSIRQRSDPANLAVRFSHHPSNVYSFNTSVASAELRPKQEQYRCYKDRQDVWAPFQVKAGDRASIDIQLTAFPYSNRYDRGRLVGFDSHAVRDIANTIARLGIIDRDVVGTNGWFSGYVCLHEQWTADLGLAIEDSNEIRSCAASLDKWRDQAIGTDGRVKSRWAYGDYDAMPGTYDANGFYEAQWGWLMDSQTGYVTDVAEQFQLSGDRAWVAGHKASCEKALEYLLRRDFDGDGLVKMIDDTVRQKRSSDWIDIVWSAYENGYVNAQLYNALRVWAEVEEILGDPSTASRYRAAAAKLKRAFNKSASEGGLWDPAHGCYDYWREKDGAIHGTNMVIPVNFMAIAYGICDDPARRATILDGIEKQMQAENLFMWPLCMTSFTPEEGGGGPFPTYENGDIFVGWAELGMRCYAPYKPSIAIRVAKNVMAKYGKDGLAFQRYLRKSQQGAGDDILASMASPIVGLYRDIYGIVPRWNRLLLDPHGTRDLEGSSLNYRLRGRDYEVDYRQGQLKIVTGNSSVQGTGPFAVAFDDRSVRFFEGHDAEPSLEIATPEVNVSIEKWSPTVRAWSVESASKSLPTEIYGLPANHRIRVKNGGHSSSLFTDSNGHIRLALKPGHVEMTL